MFVLTMNRTGLRRLGVAALCGVVLTGTVMVVNRHLEKADAAPTAAESAGERIATTQDIGAYFSARGLEVDLSTAAVDEVKVPRRWDEDFKAFDEVVKQSGQSLKKYRGKAVESGRPPARLVPRGRIPARRCFWCTRKSRWGRICAPSRAARCWG